MTLKFGYPFPAGNGYLCLKKELNRNIKLIWDFRGPEAVEIAKHHVVITVNESDMKIYRDALRPHRGLVSK